VGTPEGLQVVDPVNGVLTRSVGEMQSKNVLAIGFDSTRALWVGTQDGLYKLNPYDGSLLGQVRNLPAGRVLAVAPDVGNKVWVGTSEGLAWVSLTTGRSTVHGGFINPAFFTVRN
jgi:ligand-binding sensor domain-containing protein